MQNRTPRWTSLNRVCHALAAQLDMDHQLLSEISCQEHGVASWSELGVPELITVRDRLKEEVTEHFRLSEKQLGEIYKYGYKILHRDAPWIRGFIFKQTGTHKPVQDLSGDEASKVISGMRAIAGK